MGVSPHGPPCNPFGGPGEQHTLKSDTPSLGPLPTYSDLTLRVFFETEWGKGAKGRFKRGSQGHHWKAVGTSTCSLAVGSCAHPTNCRDALRAGPLKGCLGLWEGDSVEEGEDMAS